MKGVFSAPGDYIHFKSQVPLHKISIGSRQWRYYEFGPKVVPPLICLPGTPGTADVYYKQIMSLSNKGYRVISVDIPRVWNHHEWIQAFEKFLDAIDVHHVHLYGTSLGGFLAQLFAQHRPRRVRSLILSNTFLDTQSFSASMPWAPVVSWTPSFLLKRYVLIGIRDGPHEPFIADSVDFVVSQTNDYCAIPRELKDQVSEKYPGARRASLKSGGDFPFLSRPDEVNLHLQLHLRRVGVEAKPDIGLQNPRDSSGGGSSDKNKEKEDSDNPPKDHSKGSPSRDAKNKEKEGANNDPSNENSGESSSNPTSEDPIHFAASDNDGSDGSKKVNEEIHKNTASLLRGQLKPMLLDIRVVMEIQLILATQAVELTRSYSVLYLLLSLYLGNLYNTRCHRLNCRQNV
ncbi:maspardin-like isoform X2 [Papaver somniferum]|uniref:maspardin-like isoform X2 n=1 Tax=Papaver somniferum TaxID=3469 RepID=UPI000E6FC478|nr:maspardin-like isoform X2 [Papaver somniferum]